MIAFVWAQDENGVIGLDGGMPWHLPNDLKIFKKITSNHTVVMGRKTYEGLPFQPLPNRKNIILSRSEDYEVDEAVQIITSKDEMLEYATKTGEDLYIIGGSQIFELFMDEVDVLYKTVIHDEFEGDTYVPEFEWDNFEIDIENRYEIEDGHPYAHTFYKLVRKH